MIILATLFVTIRVRWEISAALNLMKEAMSSDETLSPVELEVQSGYRKMMTFYHSLKWYPFILIISWAPFSVLGIPGLLHTTAGFILQFFNVVFIQGFLNALAYGFTPIVREKWSGVCLEGVPSSTFGNMAGDLEGSATHVRAVPEVENIEIPSSKRASTRQNMGVLPSVGGRARY